MNTASDNGNGNIIDLQKVFRALWRNRLWIVLSVVIFSTIFTVAAFVITPVYRASAVLISASSDRNGLSGSLGSALGQLGGLASLAGVNVGSGDSLTEEALAVLRSRRFTETFINERQLTPVLFSSEWDDKLGKWRSDTKIPTSAQAYKFFTNEVRFVLQDKKTGLVTLQVEWTNREAAADWVNDLVRRLNAEMQARSIAKTDVSIKFLEKELADTQVVATREAINRLIEAQIKQRMLANVTGEYAFRVVDPAMVPDISDKVRPKKIVLIVAGFFIGLIIGIAGVLLREFLSVHPLALD